MSMEECMAKRRMKERVQQQPEEGWSPRSSRPSRSSLFSSSSASSVRFDRGGGCRLSLRISGRERRKSFFLDGEHLGGKRTDAEARYWMGVLVIQGCIFVYSSESVRQNFIFCSRFVSARFLAQYNSDTDDIDKDVDRSDRCTSVCSVGCRTVLHWHSSTIFSYPLRHDGDDKK